MTLEKACKMILIDKPFFGLFLLGLNKQYSKLSNTACVVRKGINTELHVNEDFWNKLTDKEQEGILIHEVYHICFNHMLMWDDFSNKSIINIAADLEVNSWIERNYLPKGGVFHENYGLLAHLGLKKYYDILNIVQQGDGKAQNNSKDESNNNSKSNAQNNSEQSENKESNSTAQEIVNGLSEQNKQDLKDLIDNNSIDHSMWKDFENLSDAEKELIKNQIDHIAKQVAEQTQKMRGDIPAGLKEIIDELFKQKPAVFNWKAYFRRMLGTVIDVELKKTRKKESNRFPDASGLKHKRKTNIFLVIDTSGSVSDKELMDFFSEINHIYKVGARITVCECDSKINKIYEYSGKPPKEINGRGGTLMNPAIKYFNEHRRDYQTVIFFTDGYIEPDIEKIMGQSMWIITSQGDHNRQFPGKTIYIPEENNN